MTELPSMEQRLSAIDARLKTVAHHAPSQRTLPFITLSRMTGAGGSSLGRLLVSLLNASRPEGSPAWLFLDKELLTKALEHHQLPARLAGYLPEDKVGEIQSTIGELVGLHPPLWDLNAKVAEAILKFAHLGNVVLAGRGSAWITRHRPGGLHVRLVGSLPKRSARVAAQLHLSPAEAEAHCLKTDLARRRFVRSHFDQDVDDPQQYDLVINTDYVPLPSAARLVALALDEVKAKP